MSNRKIITFEEVRNSMCSTKESAELFTNCIDACGIEWSDLVDYSEDYVNPENGNVGGFIYYDDTNKFTKDNIENILYVFTEYQEETGTTIKIDKDQPLNFLCWFAWEDTIQKILRYKEALE